MAQTIDKRAKFPLSISSDIYFATVKKKILKKSRNLVAALTKKNKNHKILAFKEFFTFTICCVLTLRAHSFGPKHGMNTNKVPK